MFGLQDLVDHFPFCVVCKVEVAGVEVEVESPSYPERYWAPERGECMVVQHEMWKNKEEQLSLVLHTLVHLEEWTHMFSQVEAEKCKILIWGLGRSRGLCLCWQKRYFAELHMECCNETQFV